MYRTVGDEEYRTKYGLESMGEQRDDNVLARLSIDE